MAEFQSTDTVRFGQPVVVIIEDRWHGNLKVGFLQWHKWKKTGVEENIELDKSVSTGWDSGWKWSDGPWHGEEKTNRWVCFVTLLCCPLAEISPHTPSLNSNAKLPFWIYCTLSPVPCTCFQLHEPSQPLQLWQLTSPLGLLGQCWSASQGTPPTPTQMTGWGCENWTNLILTKKYPHVILVTIIYVQPCIS